MTFLRRSFGAAGLALACAGIACGSAQDRAGTSRDRTEVRVVKPGQPAPPPLETDDILFNAPPSASLAQGSPVHNHFHAPPLPKVRPAPIIRLAALDQWSSRYPFASQELGGWVKSHPEAAREMFEWDRDHPDRVEALTTWAIDHPYGDYTAFLASRTGWDASEERLQERHVAAMTDYMRWCRKSPEAALELVRHGTGLAWAGEHLYGQDVGVARAPK